MTTVRVRVGTSGFSYAAWKGTFYPEELPDGEMLPFYATKMSAVEINNTYYRMPASTMLQHWGEATPSDFAFVLKAPRYIIPQKKKPAASSRTSSPAKKTAKKTTVEKPARDIGDAIKAFFERGRALEAKFAATLVQIPPFFKKRDAAMLDDFLALFPTGERIAIDFRNADWFNDETFGVLSKRGVALCVSDADELSSPVLATCDWVYVRLRRTQYTNADLQKWAERIQSMSAKEAFVFFKHEESGTGPQFAAEFMRFLES